MIIDEVYCALVQGASRSFHQLAALFVVADSDLTSAEDVATELDLVLFLQPILGQILIVHPIARAQDFPTVLHIMHVIVLAKE